MGGYYFKPMMAVYSRFIGASTEWLMSADGRRLMAKSIWLCRKLHGRDEAKRFWLAMIAVGCRYPRLLPTSLD